MSDSLTLLQSKDSEMILAAQAVIDEARKFREELDEELAQRIIEKLGAAFS